MTQDLATLRFGEIGLGNFAPYLMNRIMGRYNASMREEMAELGLTTPKVRCLISNSPSMRWSNTPPCRAPWTGWRKKA